MKFYITSKISDNMFKTPEGYLLCVGVPIARTGDMVYGEGETPLEPGEDGKVIVTRTAEEVFRPETVASFEGKSFTIQHPEDFVVPDNWATLTKGIAKNLRRGTGANENDLLADILVTEKTAIQLVESGVREVSCGYEAEYVQTGIGRGVQKNIIGNHIALVQQGRAGSSYAINDHIGKGSPMKLSDKLKAYFAKAQDEALKIAETADAEEPPKKEEKPKEESKDSQGYDELVQMMKDMSSKLEGMAPKAADATKPPSEGAPAETVAKDEPVESGLEARLKKCEEMLAKLMEMESQEAGDEAGEEEAEESEDEDCEDKSEEGMLVGDSASRVEILAPGMKASGKDFKAKALLAAYETKDGKEVIDVFTKGEALDVKDEKKVDTLFIAASELLKVKRTASLSKAKTHDDFRSNIGEPKGAMTPERLNEIHAKFYNQH